MAGPATLAAASLTAPGPCSPGSLALRAWLLPRTCSVTGTHSPSWSQPLETPIVLYCFCHFCPLPPLVSSGSLQIFSYPFFKSHKLEHDLEFLHSAGDGAQNLVHARQALYPLSYILAPSCLFDVVSCCHHLSLHCLLPVLPSPPTSLHDKDHRQANITQGLLCGSMS